MTLEGTVVNGQIVLDAAPPLPEGARVRVEVCTEPTLGFLLKFAGTANDLPPDLADRHDHYLHGKPE